MANESLPTLLEAHREEIKGLLPDYIDLERFLINARSLAQNHLLANCSAQTLLNCAIEAARRGLEIGGPNKHCAVVPFKQSAILIVQWQGKAFLWTRAGAIRKLISRPVSKGDQFRLIQGDEDRIEHTPDLDTPRAPSWLNDWDNIVGAYAIAWLWSGEKVHSFVSRAQVLRVMESVKKRNNGVAGFGWNDWKPEMACKTAVHRLDGFIQPPPNWSAAQIDAWQRASTNRDDSIDVSFSEYDDVNDDLPGAKETQRPASRRESVIPPTGSKPVASSSSAHPPQPATGTKPSGPSPASPADTSRIPMERQDNLIEDATMAGWKASGLLKHVKERYGAGNLDQLTN